MRILIMDYERFFQPIENEIKSFGPDKSAPVWIEPKEKPKSFTRSHRRPKSHKANRRKEK